MSRSFKKFPMCPIKGDSKKEKQLANRRFRRNKLISSKRADYKKYYPSYDICDWKMISTKEEFLNFYRSGQNPYLTESFKTEEEALIYWYKVYKAK